MVGMGYNFNDGSESKYEYNGGRHISINVQRGKSSNSTLFPLSCHRRVPVAMIRAHIHSWTEYVTCMHNIYMETLNVVSQSSL